MKRHSLTPMLGPASNYPAGTFQWAESLGLELSYLASRPARHMEELTQFVGQLVKISPPPWGVFPDPPCNDIDAFFRLCTGLTYEQVWRMADSCGGHDLPRFTNGTDLPRDDTPLLRAWNRATLEERNVFLADLRRARCSGEIAK